MDGKIPTCLVMVKYSYWADPKGKNPAASRKEDWLTGVLFECPISRRKRIVGIRTSQCIQELPELLNISGIAGSSGFSRDSDFKRIVIDLDSELEVQKDKGNSQGFDLFWTDISDDEHPGWRSNTGKLIAAIPVALPDYRVWTSAKDRTLPEGSYSVCGVRQTATALELVNVRASVKDSRALHEEVVLEFDQGVVGQINFVGSPIFDGMGHLVALGLFAGQLKSGGVGLVGKSIKQLAAAYGQMIEGAKGKICLGTH